MAKRARVETREDEGTTRPRLGIVMRFPPKAAGAGIKQMESGGFRVATSADFKSAGAVPNDFDGADVQYFERFGIAIIRSEEDRLKPVLEKAQARNVETSVRPERFYHALGKPAAREDASGDLLTGSAASVDHNFLRGYREATN